MQLASGRMNSSLMLHGLNCENSVLLHMLSCAPRSCFVPSRGVRCFCLLQKLHNGPFFAFHAMCPLQ